VIAFALVPYCARVTVMLVAVGAAVTVTTSALIHALRGSEVNIALDATVNVVAAAVALAVKYVDERSLMRRVKRLDNPY
jgi:intracellular sulfur oxidation DsrE/DsrF family protein